LKLTKELTEVCADADSEGSNELPGRGSIDVLMHYAAPDDRGMDDDLRSELAASFRVLLGSSEFTGVTVTTEPIGDPARDASAIVRLRAPSVPSGCAALRRCAELPTVLWLEMAAQMEMANALSAAVLQQAGPPARAGTALNTPLWDQGLDGTNQLVGVGDTGIDWDSCFFSDSGSPPPFDQVDSAAPKIVAYWRISDSSDEPSGHGMPVPIPHAAIAPPPLLHPPWLRPLNPPLSHPPTHQPHHHRPIPDTPCPLPRADSSSSLALLPSPRSRSCGTVTMLVRTRA
jgi:hypothetical protein